MGVTGETMEPPHSLVGQSEVWSFSWCLAVSSWDLRPSYLQSFVHSITCFNGYLSLLSHCHHFLICGIRNYLKINYWHPSLCFFWRKPIQDIDKSITRRAWKITELCLYCSVTLGDTLLPCSLPASSSDNVSVFHSSLRSHSFYPRLYLFAKCQSQW